MIVRPTPPSGAEFPTGQGCTDATNAPQRNASTSNDHLLGEHDLSNHKDAHGRRKWNIMATKIPYAQRDIAHSVIPDEDAAAERQFQVISPASVTPDDDAEFGVGSVTMYSLRLTDGEAARFRSASNAREVSLPRLMKRPSLPGDSFNLPTGLVK